MSIGTFHSICAGILRKNIHHLGYNNSFTIYDSSDSKELVKNVIKKGFLTPDLGGDTSTKDITKKILCEIHP